MASGSFIVGANSTYSQTGGNFWVQGGNMIIEGYAKGEQIGNAYTYGSITVDGTYAAKGNNGQFIISKLSIYSGGN